MKHTMRFLTMTAVLTFLAATVVYSQSQSQPRTRLSPRARARAGGQQGQMMPPQMGQMGQPDFISRMAERNARHMQEMQQDIEEMQRLAEESRNRAIQQALRASDEQWRQLKPKLDRIQRLRDEAEVAVEPGSMGGNGSFQMSGNGGGFQGQGFMFGGGFGGSSGGGMGGGTGPIDILDPNGSPAPTGNNTWSSFSSSGSKSIMEMSEGEALCQELQHLLQGQSVPSAEVSQKVAALRRIRVQARENLAKARQELRASIHPNQEPALIVMGYLD